ncbi:MULTISPECIES: hypothetical protein [Bacillus]|uniref:hypothetical protein n=1 Tax=Bacillus TaxID=1386 RepID=UPI00047DCE91|nr:MULTISPECIES: hypothetical protein [Bacillus]QHZ47106.1 hypothetical protein M654_012780 [Bacillus sp. NSP9.1]WFA07194.1 hypothetical protein P3X63_10715 [Bacillus sp. HSf4]
MKSGRLSKYVLSLFMTFAMVLSFHATSANAASDGAITPSECPTFIVPDDHQPTVKVGESGHWNLYCGSTSGAPIDFSNEDLYVSVDDSSALNVYANPDRNTLDYEGLGKGNVEVMVYWANKQPGTTYTFLLVEVK